MRGDRLKVLIYLGRYLLPVFLLISFIYNVYAVFEDVSCSNYYPLNSLYVEFSPEKMEYFPGETAKFRYKIVNGFNTPIVEGGVKVLVLYYGSDSGSQNRDGKVVDEFHVLSNVSLQAGDFYSGSFVWSIPKKAASGVYGVKVFFNVKDWFDVLGIASSHVSTESVNFKVSGTGSEIFFLERDKTTLNMQKYYFNEEASIDEGKPVNVKTFLNNPGREEVNVLYELFNLKDLGGRLEAYTKTEVFTGSAELYYNLPPVEAGEYVAKITAYSSSWKSIIYTRFRVGVPRQRFIWIGLDHFPLMQYDKSFIGLCLLNPVQETSGGYMKQQPLRVFVEVLDESRDIVFREDSILRNFSADVSGWRAAFTTPKQLTKLVLRGELYSLEGGLIDSVEVLYDYAGFMNIDKYFILKVSEKTKEVLNYEVEYLSKYGDFLEGDVVVYLSDSDGRVVSLTESHVFGRLTGSFGVGGLSEGLYTLKAVEKNNSLSYEVEVYVGGNSESGSVTQSTYSTSTTAAAAVEMEEIDDVAHNVFNMPYPILFDKSFFVVFLVFLVLFFALFYIKTRK